MSSFRFKQFEVAQEQSAMKVNTDGVLLGAWMGITGAERAMLDVGTGSGVIALMAAQRVSTIRKASDVGTGATESSICIEAIDIDENSLKDAEVNFFNSSFLTDTLELKARLISFQELAREVLTNIQVGEEECKYDLIFSNPPYFINSLKASEEARSNARHTDTLGQGELIKASMELLKPEGRLAIILPAVEGEQLLSKISFLESKKLDDSGLNLHMSRLCKVHTTIKKPAKRWLMEFVYSNKKPLEEYSELVMMSGGNFTPQYKALTKDFYLNF